MGSGVDGSGRSRLWGKEKVQVGLVAAEMVCSGACIHNTTNEQ